jgi:hypothetical protein
LKELSLCGFGRCSPASHGGVDIHDDHVALFFWMAFTLDGGDGVEEQVAGVSHDGGAARRDFVAGEEFVEFAKGAVDGDAGSEFLGVPNEPGSDVGGILFLFELGGVIGAEVASNVRDELAATEFAGAVLTVGKLSEGVGVSCFWTRSVVHFVPRFGERV